ncbi:MAG: hypothetical protein ABJP48_09430 [Erythrobacter sp.]
MAEKKSTKAAAKPRKAAAKRTTKKAATKKSTSAKSAEDMPSVPVETTNANRTEAKSRFNAALEEAKAGAAALRAEAGERAGSYRENAMTKGDDLVTEAKAYGEQARSKAGDLAVEGKTAASDAIASVGRVVGDTAEQIDERFGEQYGDYARRASRTLVETSAKIDAKNIDELGDDAREFVRKSPGVAVGIAAVAGFLLARLFRGSRD